MLQHTPTLTKPLDNAIIPIGGLGNRLLRIFKAIQLSHSPLNIIWVKNPHCQIDLNQLIKILIPHQTKTYNNYHTALKNNPNNYGLSYPSLDANLYWLHTQLPNYIQFQPPQNPQPPQPIAIHARRSDWGLMINGQINHNHIQQQDYLDQEFIKYLKPIIKNQPFYLSTDSQRTKYHFQTHYPTQLHHQKQANYPTNYIRNHQETISAWNDLHALATATTIIRDSGSTYSLIAHIINRNNIITWQRPTLQIPGTGLEFQEDP